MVHDKMCQIQVKPGAVFAVPLQLRAIYRTDVTLDQVMYSQNA